ncbi:TPA: DNA breaking-rejoining protein [Stenotrophomonas maltophilia]|uniref:DNA breaking-rejoining protein n=1 Tax=Stenotrophomonas maltophilia TaxID=40324 RepID=UPI000C147CFE|nr:DNA breaking-rejoining protein [Stenotrophomonas maltophilia]MBA0234552.1 DNA breaking-rejoining protein [Stenotrophomonas maltophilia]MBA0269026.1 DNA breaking-rejoining protein [Stenotrophomonas maltophilia]MBA0334276.1 DNA breaking-rejoining protein [Stenotrophomonas maltophilia]MBN5124062.1 DNA breaking-rejoining protein [Stenotrophomonas maltophilia]MBO3003137.1 DNA breaking-rejoining protein [Stenotrophomonas maltophilia]
MMKTTILLSTLAFAAMTSPAWAQSSGQTPPARTLSTVDAQELKASATGRSFDVGGTRFQLSPSTTVKQASGGQFTITPPAAATTSSRTKRSLDGAAAAPADAGAGKFAAAVSRDGAPVVATSRVKVFFTDAASAQRAATATGGTVVKVSKASGQAIVEYPSVNAALDATTRLLSIAGIRATEPDVVQWEETK